MRFLKTLSARMNSNHCMSSTAAQSDRLCQLKSELVQIMHFVLATPYRIFCSISHTWAAMTDSCWKI